MQFKPQAILHPQLQLDATQAVVKEIWPQVIQTLLPELEKQLPLPGSSPVPDQPPSAACDVAALPQTSTPEPLLSAPISSQPIPDPPTQPESHPEPSGLGEHPPSDSTIRPAAHNTAKSNPISHGGHHLFLPSAPPCKRGSTDQLRSRAFTVPGALEPSIPTRTPPAAKRHSDTTAVIGVPQATGHSRFRSPGDAIRSLSVTNGRPRWQRWLGVQACLASGELAHATPAEPPYTACAPLATIPLAADARAHA